MSYKTYKLAGVIWNDDGTLSLTPPKYDTLYIDVENVIIKDKTLGFEIVLSKYLNDIEKINISGITFIKENKDV